MKTKPQQKILEKLERDTIFQLESVLKTISSILHNYPAKRRLYERTSVDRNIRLSTELTLLKNYIREKNCLVYFWIPMKSHVHGHNWVIIKDKYEFFHIIFMSSLVSNNVKFKNCFFLIESILKEIFEIVRVVDEINIRRGKHEKTSIAVRFGFLGCCWDNFADFFGRFIIIIIIFWISCKNFNFFFALFGFIIILTFHFI